MSLSPLSRVIQLIEQRTGLAVGSLLREDVSHVVERLSGGDLQRWASLLDNAADNAPVWQALVAQFTIGETYFMRDALHFKLLREKLLPPLVMKRRQADDYQLNLWSIGCSTGEEAYSLAITLHEFLPDIDRWQINITATDINIQSIEHAQRAQYRLWSFRQTSETFVRRYFKRINDTFILRDEIRRMVTFVQGNLLQPPPLPPLDVIFCRNILLYFTPEQVAQAENQLFQALLPEGWLILGSAEALRTRRDRWQILPIAASPIYQKSRTRHTQSLRSITTETKTRPLGKPDLSIAKECSEAVAAIRANRTEDAERILIEALDAAPRSARAHTLLAFVFANRSAYPEALAHVKAALKSDATYADGHYLRGIILLEEGDAGACERALQAALYYHRDHVPALLMMGTLQMQRGDIPRAHKLWARAAAIAETLAPDDALGDVDDMTASDCILWVTQQLDL